MALYSWQHSCFRHLNKLRAWVMNILPCSCWMLMILSSNTSLLLLLLLLVWASSDLIFWSLNLDLLWRMTVVLVSFFSLLSNDPPFASIMSRDGFFLTLLLPILVSPNFTYLRDNGHFWRMPWCFSLRLAIKWALFEFTRLAVDAYGASSGAWWWWCLLQHSLMTGACSLLDIRH